MRKLQPLELPALDSYLMCAQRVQDKALRDKFVQAAGHVSRAAQQYEAAAASAQLHTIPEHSYVGNVSAGEMADLYERLCSLKTLRPAIYERLMLLPPHSICPLCSHRTVSTLDHHLPKKKFPAFAVAPLNLVPACMECNWVKGEDRPTCEVEQTFHPYFDDFGSDTWLQADLQRLPAPTLRFFVRSPAAWPATRAARAEHHFVTFNLAPLYMANAAEELVGIQYHLELIFDRAGVEGVRAHLMEVADSQERANPNSWRAAMYRALSADTWFQTEGFAKINGTA